MKAIGIILAGGNSEKRMGELTESRAAAAMPVGGAFRAVDFPLTSMTSSGIGKIAVITQYNSRSLHDHLVSSKWWDLGEKKGGCLVLSPYTSKDNSSWFRGTPTPCIRTYRSLKEVTSRMWQYLPATRFIR